MLLLALNGMELAKWQSALACTAADAREKVCGNKSLHTATAAFVNSRTHRNSAYDAVQPLSMGRERLQARANDHRECVPRARARECMHVVNGQSRRVVLYEPLQNLQRVQLRRTHENG